MRTGLISTFWVVDRSFVGQLDTQMLITVSTTPIEINNSVLTVITIHAIVLLCETASWIGQSVPVDESSRITFSRITYNLTNHIALAVGSPKVLRLGPCLVYCAVIGPMQSDPPKAIQKLLSIQVTRL